MAFLYPHVYMLYIYMYMYTNYDFCMGSITLILLHIYVPTGISNSLIPRFCKLFVLQVIKAGQRPGNEATFVG